MRFLGYDSETWALAPGMPAPPIVCATFAEASPSGDIDKTIAVNSDREDMEQRIGALLRDPGVYVTGAYTAFDMTVVYENFPALRSLVLDAYEAGRVIDVQLREKLLDMARDTVQQSYSLAAVVLRRFGRDLSGDKTDPLAWRLRYRELSGVPLALWPQRAVDYATEDAAWALLIAQAQLQDMVDLNYQCDDAPMLIPGERDCSRASFALACIGGWGVRTDPERVEAYAADLDAQIQRYRAVLLGDRASVEHALLTAGDDDRATLTAWLEAMAAPAFEPLAYYKKEKGVVRLSTKKAPTQNRVIRAAVAKGLEDFGEDGITVAEEETIEQVADEKGVLKDRKVYRVYAVRGEETLGELSLPRTDTLQIATGADVCAHYRDPILAAYEGYKKAEKLISTYLPTVRSGVERPIVTSYDALKENLRTGAREPNLQNLPKKGPTRPCYTARKGFRLSSIDLDGAEMCGWAEVCYRLFGYSTLGDALNKGQDAHTRLALRLPEYAGKTYEDLIALKKARDPRFKIVRDLMKIPNFSRAGGGGAERTQAELWKKDRLWLTVPEIRQLFAYWAEEWQEAAEWLAYGGKATAGGSATYVDPISKIRIAGLGYCDFLNYHFSGLIAQAFKHALWRCQKAILLAGPGDPLYLTRIVIEVHDEIISEHPEERAHEAAYALRDVFLAAAQEWFTRVKLTAEPALMRHWYKGADPVFDASGRLVPWEPKA